MAGFASPVSRLHASARKQAPDDSPGASLHRDSSVPARGLFPRSPRRARRHRDSAALALDDSPGAELLRSVIAANPAIAEILARANVLSGSGSPESGRALLHVAPVIRMVQQGSPGEASPVSRCSSPELSPAALDSAPGLTRAASRPGSPGGVALSTQTTTEGHVALAFRTQADAARGEQLIAVLQSALQHWHGGETSASQPASPPRAARGAPPLSRPATPGSVPTVPTPSSVKMAGAKGHASALAAPGWLLQAEQQAGKSMFDMPGVQWEDMSELQDLYGAASLPLGTHISIVKGERDVFVADRQRWNVTLAAVETSLRIQRARTAEAERQAAESQAAAARAAAETKAAQRAAAQAAQAQADAEAAQAAAEAEAHAARAAVAAKNAEIEAAHAETQKARDAQAAAEASQAEHVAGMKVLNADRERLRRHFEAQQRLLDQLRRVAGKTAGPGNVPPVVSSVLNAASQALSSGKTALGASNDAVNAVTQRTGTQLSGSTVVAPTRAGNPASAASMASVAAAALSQSKQQSTAPSGEASAVSSTAAEQLGAERDAWRAQAMELEAQLLEAQAVATEAQAQAAQLASQLDAAQRGAAAAQEHAAAAAAAAAQQQTELEALIDELRAQLEAARADSEDKAAEVGALQEVKAELERAAAAAQAEHASHMEAAAARAQALQAELDAAQAELAAAMARAAEAARDATALRSALAQARRDNEDVQRDLEALHAEKDMADAALADARSSIRDLSGEVASEPQAVRVQRRLSSLMDGEKRAHDGTRALLAAAKAQLGAVRAERDEARTRADELAGRIARAETAAATAKESARVATTAADTARGTAAALREELDDRNARVASLDQELATQTAEFSINRDLLAAAQRENGRLRHDRRLLDDQMAEYRNSVAQRASAEICGMLRHLSAAFKPLEGAAAGLRRAKAVLVTYAAAHGGSVGGLGVRDTAVAAVELGAAALPWGSAAATAASLAAKMPTSADARMVATRRAAALRGVGENLQRDTLLRPGQQPWPGVQPDLAAEKSALAAAVSAVSESALEAESAQRRVQEELSAALCEVQGELRDLDDDWAPGNQAPGQRASPATPRPAGHELAAATPRVTPMHAMGPYAMSPTSSTGSELPLLVPGQSPFAPAPPHGAAANGRAAPAPGADAEQVCTAQSLATAAAVAANQFVSDATVAAGTDHLNTMPPRSALLRLLGHVATSEKAAGQAAAVPQSKAAWATSGLAPASATHGVQGTAEALAPLSWAQTVLSEGGFGSAGGEAGSAVAGAAAGGPAAFSSSTGVASSARTGIGAGGLGTASTANSQQLAAVASESAYMLMAVAKLLKQTQQGLHAAAGSVVTHVEALHLNLPQPPRIAGGKLVRSRRAMAGVTPGGGEPRARAGDLQPASAGTASAHGSEGTRVLAAALDEAASPSPSALSRTRARSTTRPLDG